MEPEVSCGNSDIEDGRNETKKEVCLFSVKTLCRCGLTCLLILLALIEIVTAILEKLDTAFLQEMIVNITCKQKNAQDTRK